MTTPSRIIHALAGSPVVEGCVPVDDLCRMCAQPTTVGMVFDCWQGSQFTDQNKVKCTASHHICAACIWAHSWVQPPGMEPPPEGRRGLNLRLFSHFHDARGYHYWNKANKRECRDWLRAPKSGEWFACIADTGQKHVLPYTQMNPPGGRGVVRFEERDVVLGDWACIDQMTALLTDGVTKEAIDGATYNTQHWTDSEALLRQFEREFGAVRGSGWFDLCLWLAQRDETEWKAIHDDRKRQRAARKADDRPDPGAKASVSRSRSKPAKALGPTPGPRKDGGADKLEPRRVGDIREPIPEPVLSGQLSLFGD